MTIMKICYPQGRCTNCHYIFKISPIVVSKLILSCPKDVQKLPQVVQKLPKKSMKYFESKAYAEKDNSVANTRS